MALFCWPLPPVSLPPPAAGAPCWQAGGEEVGLSGEATWESWSHNESLSHLELVFLHSIFSPKRLTIPIRDLFKSIQ